MSDKNYRPSEQSKEKAPVVYLRSFLGQGFHLSDFKSVFEGKTLPGSGVHWKDAGHYVGTFLGAFGPVRELAPPPGKARFQPWSPSRPQQERIADEHWRQTILEWLPRASAVLLQLDPSPGLQWEIAQLVRLVSPTKVLMVLPSTEGDYAALVSSTKGWFPRALPGRLPDSRLVTFAIDWEPSALERKESPGYMWHTLEPFFEQNQIEVDWRTPLGIKGHKSSNGAKTRS